MAVRSPPGEFQFPVTLNDLFVEDEEKYFVPQPRSEEDPTRDEDSQQDLLDSTHNHLTADPYSLFTKCRFDLLFLFLRRFKRLKIDVKKHMVEVLVKGNESCLTKVPGASKGTDQERRECRNSIRMFLYMFAVIIKNTERGQKLQKAKKDKNITTYDWKSDKERILGSMREIIKHPQVKSLWEMNKPEEEFAQLFFDTGAVLFENSDNLSSSIIRPVMKELMGLAIGTYGCVTNTWSSVVRLLQTCTWTNETKMAVSIADLCKYISITLEQPSSLDDFLKEIQMVEVGTLNRNGHGAKCLANVFPELARRMPREMCNRLDLVSYHLGRDSHHLRSGTVKFLGILLMEYKRGPETEEQYKKTRRIFMDLLKDRLYDRTSHVRSTVVKTWAELCSNKLIPVSYLADYLLTEIAGRLEDKGVYVRKQALIFFKRLIVNWPFFPSDFDLDRVRAEMNKKHEEVQNALARLTEMQRNYWNSVLVKNIGQSLANDENKENGAEEAPSFEGVDVKLLKENQASMNFHRLSLKCVQHLYSALEKASVLLNSKAKFDVLEAIDLFKEASSHSMTAVENGYKRMLSLVWDKDNVEFQPAMLQAYYHKYFWTLDVTESLNEKRQEALAAADKLVKLTMESTLASITCIEEMMRLMTMGVESKSKNGVVKEIKIPSTVFAALWHIFKNAAANERRRGALDLLRMAAVAKPAMMAQNAKDVIEIGLGPLAEKDPGLAKTALLALGTLKGSGGKYSSAKESTVAIAPELLTIVWEKVVYMLHGGFLTSKHWFAMAEAACALVFKLHKRPEKFSQKILKSISFQLFTREEKENASQDPASQTHNDTQDPNNTKDPSSMGVDEQPAQSEEQKVEAQVPQDQEVKQAETTKESDHPVQPKKPEEARKSSSIIHELKFERYRLAKFFFLIGHVAIKILVFIEEKEQELKKMKNELNNRKKTEAKNSEDEDLEEQLGMHGAEDFEVERMRVQAEKCLVMDRTLLGTFIPLIKRVILRPNNYKSPILQISAVLAFCKYMCIDQKFCEEHLQILFTLLKKAQDARIKANIIISLGDMAFRFPNAMDAWCPNIYEHLRDEDNLVRKNTLMVLTHLILNDMIKVKDSIAEIALLLEDDVSEIRDLARLFFAELSKKGHKRKNPIYNILPDTISRLSDKDREPQVEDRVFEHVLRFLLEFVDGERQKVNLVEKLCKRFVATTEVGMHRRLAFCLSQLTFSEQVMKKIVDEQTSKLYVKTLGDEVVWDHFQTIIKKARPHYKPEFKETFDMWENLLKAKHISEKENRDADARANKRASKRNFTQAQLEDIEKEVQAAHIQKERKLNPTESNESEAAPPSGTEEVTGGPVQPNKAKDAGKPDNSDEKSTEGESESESPAPTRRRRKNTRGRGRGRGRRGRGRGGRRGRKREEPSSDSSDSDDLEVSESSS